MDVNGIRPDAPSVRLVEQPVSPQEVAERRVLIRAIRAINESGSIGQDNELTYAVDRESRRTVVRIVNRQTREVIQQIPSERVLRLANQLGVDPTVPERD